MRGIFRSVDDLKATINRVPQNNADPKPFIWTADPRRVLAAVKRGKQALEPLVTPCLTLSLFGACKWTQETTNE